MSTISQVQKFGVLVADTTNGIIAVTGGFNASGAYTGTTGTFSGALQGSSVAATGALSGASAAITNGITATSLTASGAVNAASAAISGTITTANLSISGTISGAGAPAAVTVLNPSSLTFSNLTNIASSATSTINAYAFQQTLGSNVYTRPYLTIGITPTASATTTSFAVVCPGKTANFSAATDFIGPAPLVTVSGVPCGQAIVQAVSGGTTLFISFTSSSTTVHSVQLHGLVLN